MIQALGQEKNAFMIKTHICFAIIAISIILPIQSIKQSLQQYRALQKFTEEIKLGPTQQQPEIPIERALPIFQYTPYAGNWNSINRRSSLLELDNGAIQITSTLNKSKQITIGNQIDAFGLIIKIYDGQNLDSDYHKIVIEASQLIVQQKFQEGRIQYQTAQPVIGVRTYHNGFQSTNQQTIYINKLVFILQFSEVLTIDFIISSQYKINIIGRNLVEYYQSLYDILFSLLLSCSSIIQIISLIYIFQLMKSKYQPKQAPQRYSFIAFFAGTITDSVLALGVCSLCFESQRRMAIYIVPSALCSFKIYFMDLRIMETLYQIKQKKLFSFYLLYFTSVLLIICLIYATNTTGFLCLFASLFCIAPQLFKNYSVGYKVKEGFNSFMRVSYLRYLCMFYLKLYKGNIFHLKTNYYLMIICGIFIGIQVLLMYAQNQYGVNAILPKFLYNSGIKYYVNDLQFQFHQNCPICKKSLSEIPSSLQQDQIQEMYNNVIMAPCKHRYHVFCFKKWIKKRKYCIMCHQVLPPLDEKS